MTDNTLTVTRNNPDLTTGNPEAGKPGAAVASLTIPDGKVVIIVPGLARTTLSAGNSKKDQPMKTTTTSLLVALTLGASLWNIAAQDQEQPQRRERPARHEGGPGAEGRRPLPPLMAALDANGDGVIDAKEISGAVAALLKLDKNADGQLTVDELRPARPEGDRGPGRPGGPEGAGDRRGPGRPHPEGAPVDQAGADTHPQPPARPLPPVVAALDVNGDGVIDAKELANAPAALQKLDKNGDGQLTADEVRPAHPEGGRGPGGPEGRRPRGPRPAAE